MAYTINFRISLAFRITKILGLFLFIFLLAIATGQAQVKDLNYYLDLGLKNSPLLKDYGNQVLSARIDSLKIRAARKPQVNGVSGISYAPVVNGYGYDQAISNGGNYNAQIAASQNFLNWNILSAQYMSAHIQSQSLVNKKSLGGHDFRHSITDLYLVAYADYKAMENTAKLYSLLNEEESILRPLVDHGIIKQSAYYTFDMELSSQKITLNELKIQYGIDVVALNILCGLNDTGSVKLEEPHPEQKSSLSTFYNSGFYQQFFIDSLRINNEKALVDIRYKPHLFWNADAGILSSTPDNLYRHAGVSAGIGFQIPIYDGNLRKLDYQKLGLEEQSRTNYTDYFRSQYTTQTSQLTKRLEAINEINKQLESQLSKSENLLEMGRKELNRGDISVTDFLLMVRGNIEIRNNLNQSQVKAWQILNDINYWNW